MSAIKTYNCKEVTISLGGHVVTGYAEDSFVSIQPNSEGITKKVGCDGEIVRSISPDDTYNVTLVLLWESPTTGFLQNKFAQDVETGNGLFPILIQDGKGSMVFQAQDAWVVSSASRQYGRESGNREWQIATGRATINEGGSNQPA